MNAPRSRRVEVDGWVVFDKPVGMTSTRAVALLKRRFNAKEERDMRAPSIRSPRACCRSPSVKRPRPCRSCRGREKLSFHGPMGRRDRHRRQRRNGHAAHRPLAFRRRNRRRAARFHRHDHAGSTGLSAIKINGERAYDIARDGEQGGTRARPVTIRQLQLVPPPARRRCRGALRQGHLCAGARPRSRPRARLFRPCDGAAAHPRRTVRGERCGLPAGAGGDGERDRRRPHPVAGRSGVERSRLHRRRP